MKSQIGKPTPSFVFLLSYYKPFAGRMIFALVAMLPASGISLAFPALTGNIIDGIIRDGSPTNVMWTGLLFLALLSIQAIIGYVVSVTMASTTERVIATLRRDLFSRLVLMPLSTFSKHRVGELSSRLSSDLTQVQESFSFSILQLLRQSVFLIGSVVLILTTSVQLTIPILVGTPIIVAAAVLLGRRIRKISTATQDALAVTSTIVEETLQSISAVKTYVHESLEVERYSKALETNVTLAIRGARLRAAFVTFIIFTIFGGIAAVILYGANLVATGDVTMGQLLSFLMYAMFVGGALGSFAELFSQIQKMLGASVRIKELIDGTVEDLGSEAPDVHLASVTLCAVTFTYPGREENLVVANISLDIPEGARVAFVGPSGAGKSTTAALIQRLYEPSSGTILYQGIPSSKLTLAQVRQNIGVVPQDIVLFGGTIAENILYGRPNATDAEVQQAAKSANALEFIERFQDGINTKVGERGIKLSGGQRQRVAIARALLKNPPILILDEATNSLDAETEFLIEEALQRLMTNRTTIIIAHRLSTVRSCDSIYVFKGGSILEHGNHQELIARGGLYNKWCDLQFVQ